MNTTLRPLATALLRRSATPAPSACRAARSAHASIPPTNHQRTPERCFFGRGSNPFGAANPLSPPQSVTASRTLACPASVIYRIISDVASYHLFLPYCQGSQVTKYSNPAPDGNTYPEEATLTIGFNASIREEFTSRIYCVPGRVVEAVSGAMEPTLSGAAVAHHRARPPAHRDPARKDGVLARLLTRWTLHPHPCPPPTAADREPSRTDVRLAIEFQFANPVYAALSAAAAPRVADQIVRAFERRVHALATTTPPPAARTAAGEAPRVEKRL